MPRLGGEEVTKRESKNERGIVPTSPPGSANKETYLSHGLSIVTRPTSLEIEAWMHRCIALARIAQARGDSPVGAVIVRNSEVVAEGIEAGKTTQDVTRHAEVEAISVARKVLDTSDLSDCLLVTTHEPCILCSYAIRHHRIPLVVFGVAVGEIGGYNSELAVLKDRSVKRWGEAPEVIGGVLEKECRAFVGSATGSSV